LSQKSGITLHTRTHAPHTHTHTHARARARTERARETEKEKILKNNYKKLHVYISTTILS